MSQRVLPVTSHATRVRGFTYLVVLFALSLIGLSLAAAGTVWSTVAAREREQQLLWTGNEFRRAIASYYRSAPQGLRAYPQDLAELVEDRRSPVLRRHLRRIYADPMTGRADWQVIRLADGAILGVASASNLRPLKRANFDPDNAAFVDAKCYCEWRFLFLPDLTPNP